MLQTSILLMRLIGETPNQFISSFASDQNSLFDPSMLSSVNIAALSCDELGFFEFSTISVQS